MARLANYLEGLPETGRPVLDKTGLAGAFGFRLDISLEAGDDRPSLFSALEDQLGLKLKPSEGPVDFLVIENVARASAN